MLNEMIYLEEMPELEVFAWGNADAIHSREFKDTEQDFLEDCGKYLAQIGAAA